jgi:hypothetical protein
MNTQKQNEQIEWENLTITDDLEAARVSMEREGRPSFADILENAIRYIAFLRGRVDIHVPAIEAPLGLDGKVQDDWLLQMLTERAAELSNDIRYHNDQANAAAALLARIERPLDAR